MAVSTMPAGMWTQNNFTRSLLTSGKKCQGLSCVVYAIIECPPPGQQPCLAGPQGNIGFNNSGYNSYGVGNVGNRNFGCFLQGVGGWECIAMSK